MSEPKGFTIEVKEGMLTCSISLDSQPGDLTGSKIAAYGALKVAEEHASIYFMRKAMIQQQILQPRPGGIKPVIH